MAIVVKLHRLRYTPDEVRPHVVSDSRGREPLGRFESIHQFWRAAGEGGVGIGRSRKTALANHKSKDR